MEGVGLLITLWSHSDSPDYVPIVTAGSLQLSLPWRTVLIWIGVIPPRRLCSPHSGCGGMKAHPFDQRQNQL